MAFPVPRYPDPDLNRNPKFDYDYDYDHDDESKADCGSHRPEAPSVCPNGLCLKAPTLVRGTNAYPGWNPGYPIYPDGGCVEGDSAFLVRMNGSKNVTTGFSGNLFGGIPANLDQLFIPAHSKHRVTWTDPSKVTLWLAVHFPDGNQ